LTQDLESTAPGGKASAATDMNFQPVSLRANAESLEDITILTFDRKINIQAGEFVVCGCPEGKTFQH
jgi:dihydroorotate dehydrogenase (NAD+) catalytic subunit